MIGKAHRVGTGFKGLASYLECGSLGRPDPDRVAWIESRNLPTDHPQAAARLMAATARDSERTRKPVYHLSISFDRGDSVDRETMRRVADRTLRDLGLHEHQVLIVAHADRAHPHLHLVVNRVHPERRTAWDNAWDYPRIERSLRAQEVELGLRVVPGKHACVPGHDLDREKSAPARRIRDDPAFLERVRREAGPHLTGARSWAEVERGLSTHGLSVEFRGGGLIVTDGVHRVKASDVDREASRARLEKRLGPLGEYRARKAVAERTLADRAARQEPAREVEARERPGPGVQRRARRIVFGDARHGLSELLGSTPASAHPRPGVGQERPQADPMRSARFLRDVTGRAAPVLEQARSWAEAERGLAEVGLSLRVEGGGFRLTDGTHDVKASEVGRAFSRFHLEKRFGPYPNDRVQTAAASLAPEFRAPEPTPSPGPPGSAAVHAEPPAPTTHRSATEPPVLPVIHAPPALTPERAEASALTSVEPARPEAPVPPSSGPPVEPAAPARPPVEDEAAPDQAADIPAHTAALPSAVEPERTPPPARRFVRYAGINGVGVQDTVTGRVYLSVSAERTRFEMERANLQAATDPAALSLDGLAAMHDEWRQTYREALRRATEERYTPRPPSRRFFGEPRPTEPEPVTPPDPERTPPSEDRAPLPPHDLAARPAPTPLPPADSPRDRPPTQRERYRPVARRFREDLAVLYVNPRAARIAFLRDLEAHGPLHACNTLAARPEAYGSISVRVWKNPAESAARAARSATDVVAQWGNDRIAVRMAAHLLREAVRIDAAERRLNEASEVFRKRYGAQRELPERQRAAEEAERAMQRTMREVYTDPASAFRQIDEFLGVNGVGATEDAIRTTPERFGILAAEIRMRYLVLPRRDTSEARWRAKALATQWRTFAWARQFAPGPDDVARAEAATNAASSAVAEASRARQSFAADSATHIRRAALMLREAAGFDPEKLDRLARVLAPRIPQTAAQNARTALEMASTPEPAPKRSREPDRDRGIDFF